jgi:cellulose biosynthesis protein BcsQ
LPPAISDEVKEIIAHCDVVFVPLIVGAFEIAGLSNVTEEIKNQGTKLGGVFVSMFNQKDDSEEYEVIKDMLKDSLMATIIPFSKTVRQSQKAEMSIEEYLDFRNAPNVKTTRKIAHAYENLTAEILARSAIK